MTCRLHTIISGCEIREAHVNWDMVKPEKAATLTGTALRTIAAVLILYYYSMRYTRGSGFAILIILEKKVETKLLHR